MSGIVAIWGSEAAAVDLYKGMHALQHRGTRYAGLVLNDKKSFRKYSQSGLVRRIFENHPALSPSKGICGISIVGNRISVDTTHTHAQPISTSIQGSRFAACLSGVVTNYGILRDRLETKGAILATDSYAELIPHLANHCPKKDLVERTIFAINQLEGSFSIAVMTPSHLIVARDKFGNRPLSLGRFADGGVVIASENSALGPLNAVFSREIFPGEILIIDEKKIASQALENHAQLKFCALELINLASPASFMFGESVFQFRKKLGVEMGRKESARADYIIPSPKAGQAFVRGFAATTKLPIVPAIIENHYALRQSFPNAEAFLSVRFGIITELLDQESVILADDIMQSARTARHLTQLLRNSRATRNIAFRASCPPVNRDLCPFRRSPVVIEKTDYDLFKKRESITEYLGADSFSFLELEELKKALGNNAKNFCLDCVTNTS